MKEVSQERPLRVLELLGNAVVGGMETYVRRLMRGLVPAQFECTAVCPFVSPFTRALQSDGVVVYIAPIREEPRWDAIQFLTALVRSLRVDVIHAHLPNAYLLASLCGALTGTPVLATVHGRNLTQMDIESYRLGHSHLSVVCQSAWLHALGLGVEPEHVTLIGNGVATDEFMPQAGGCRLHRYIGVPPSTPLIGFVGRLAAEKGPVWFLRMAALVAAVRPDVHFVLVGEGPLRVSLTQMSQRFEGNPRIHFAGAFDGMPSIFSSLRILVLTSQSEGQPLALMEAMSSGLAVVAYAVGGVPEIISDGESGVLVKPGDLEGLVESVVRLIDQPERVIEMGAAARERITSHFQLTSSVEKMAQLLQRVAARRVESRNAC